MITIEGRTVDICEYLESSERVLAAARNHPGTAKANQAIEAIVEAFSADKPMLVCGNGGSASDAMHIAGELVGRFLKERKALNCICLSSNP
jgi:D-sedoheptulose 7-phosphate isomerase